MKIYLFLSLIAVIGFGTVSCQHGSYNMGQKKKLSQAILPLKERALEQPLEIPRPMHQAAIKQLIAVMAPGDVLCVEITAENFKALGLKFNGFMAALHEGEQEKICFIMKHLLQDLAPILQHYYAQSPCAIRIAEVEDPSDFNDLSAKTGVGAGGKHDYDKRATYIGLYQDFYSHISDTSNWQILNKERMKFALEEIPPQAEDWSCGANSAARALLLIGHFNVGFDAFLRNSPKASTVVDKRGNVAFGAGLGTFLAGALLTFTPAAPIGAAMATAGWASAAGGLAAKTVKTMHTIGPSPHYLSEYINQHLSSSQYGSSQVASYASFSGCAADIIQDIKLGDPVIAFFLYEPTKWHYSNVVATQGNGDKFMILETQAYFEWLSNSDMEDLMRNDYGFLTFFGCKGHIGKYNIIRFYKKK